MSSRDILLHMVGHCKKPEVRNRFSPCNSATGWRKSRHSQNTRAMSIRCQTSEPAVWTVSLWVPNLREEWLVVARFFYRLLLEPLLFVIVLQSRGLLNLTYQTYHLLRNCIWRTQIEPRNSAMKVSEHKSRVTYTVLRYTATWNSRCSATSCGEQWHYIEVWLCVHFAWRKPKAALLKCAFERVS